MMSREMRLTSMHMSDMTVDMLTCGSSPIWTLRCLLIFDLSLVLSWQTWHLYPAPSSGERLLSCMDPQMSIKSYSGFVPVVADPTLVPSAVSLNVGVVTFHRSQRQLTERAPLCCTAAVSSSCTSRCWAEIWGDNIKSSFHTTRPDKPCFHTSVFWLRDEHIQLLTR